MWINKEQAPRAVVHGSESTTPGQTSEASRVTAPANSIIPNSGRIVNDGQAISNVEMLSSMATRKLLNQRAHEFADKMTAQTRSAQAEGEIAKASTLGNKTAQATKPVQMQTERPGIAKSQEHETMASEGYTWSGHTHPGADMNVLQPSEGDYEILKQFDQKYAVIYNSVGNYLIFGKD